MSTNLSRTSMLIAASLAGLTACAPQSPNLDVAFGSSLNQLKAYQTISPSAAQNRANPTLDGNAAGEVIGRYVKSYSAPTPHPNVFTIGVGSAGQ